MNGRFPEVRRRPFIACESLCQHPQPVRRKETADHGNGRKSQGEIGVDRAERERNKQEEETEHALPAASGDRLQHKAEHGEKQNVKRERGQQGRPSAKECGTCTGAAFLPLRAESARLSSASGSAAA